MGDPGFVMRFRAAEWPGAYCRVMREGTIQAGDAVTLEPYAGDLVTIAEIFRDYYEPDDALADIYRFRLFRSPSGPGDHAASCVRRCAARLMDRHRQARGKPASTRRIKTMNETLQLLLNRQSIRAYEERPISAEDKDLLLQATLRAPTAGNMMLYSIIEVTEQAAKDTLARTCDNQPFIARAPLVWLFLADYQRWFDYFVLSGVEELCERRGELLRVPQEGDLFLACNDALIAAQTAVVAAESLGIGSCYIGDIMENYEAHRELFGLPEYVFPICLLCFGYPTQGQLQRPMTPRDDRKFIVFPDRYRRLGKADFDKMYQDAQERFARNRIGPAASPTWARRCTCGNSPRIFR